MSGVEIGLIVGLAVSAIGNIIVLARNNIKKSKCCFGNEIEFKDGTTAAPVSAPSASPSSTIPPLHEPSRAWTITQV